MASTITREINHIRLPEQRIKEIEDLASAWPFETKAFSFATILLVPCCWHPPTSRNFTN
jgi:hypothetical protein